ncbi:MAG TPA: hypothetical protein VD731_05425 [Nitrosopumilaceae archaeon]|nr:hypothetical protein [Nitrosopumilaceae archaeon]
MAIQDYKKKNFDVLGRNFLIQILSFANGSFVSVSENSEKIGSMVVSIGTGPIATSVTVIPTKTDSLFLKLIAEKISTSIKGIGVVSLYTERELGNECSKILMSEIMELVHT